MEKKGKQRLPIIENYSVMPILNYLSSNINNSFGISMDLKKSHSTIYVHLQNLEREQYILTSSEKKNAYSLNYTKVLEELYNYLLSEIEKFYVQAKKTITLETIQIQSDKIFYVADYEKEVFPLGITTFSKVHKNVNSKEFKDKFLKNTYLKWILECLFSEIRFKTVKEMFDTIYGYFLHYEISKDTLRWKVHALSQDYEHTFNDNINIELIRKTFDNNDSDLELLLYIGSTIKTFCREEQSRRVGSIIVGLFDEKNYDYFYNKK